MSNTQRIESGSFRFAFDLGDRLDKAMRVAELTIDDMADALDVSRNTIGNYRSGRTKPSKLQLKEWSVRTGAPLEWLMTGEVGPVGIEPTRSTVESPQFDNPIVSLADRRAAKAAS